MFHFSADRLAGLDSMVLKISAPPKVSSTISNQTLNHGPYTNIEKLKRRRIRRAARAPLADKTTSRNADPRVLPGEKTNSLMSRSNPCRTPSGPNIISTKPPPSVRRPPADANSFRPLPPLPSASTLQLPSFLNFSTQSFTPLSGTRIQRSASSLPGSALFRISSTPVSSHRRVVVRRIEKTEVYEGPNWIPAFHHPNSPYVPWTSPVRRRILPSAPAPPTSPTHDHRPRSGAVAPEPWTTDTCSDTRKKSRKKKLASSWKSFKGSIKKRVQNIVACFGQSRKSCNISPNDVSQKVDILCKEDAAVTSGPSPPTRPRSSCFRSSLKSLASSDSMTLATWLAERRTTGSGIVDESGGEMSVEEYELMGSWLDLRHGEGEWVCGVRDCGLHAPDGTASSTRERFKVFRTTMPFDSPDLLSTAPQPRTPCPSMASEVIASRSRFSSLPRLPSHGADAVMKQKSEELSMPGGWTLW